MKIELTKKQKRVLKYIERNIDIHGYPPTRQEIGDKFELHVNAAQGHVSALERKGWISIVPGISRGIKIL